MKDLFIDEYHYYKIQTLSWKKNQYFVQKGFYNKKKIIEPNWFDENHIQFLDAKYTSWDHTLDWFDLNSEKEDLSEILIDKNIK